MPAAFELHLQLGKANLLIVFFEVENIGDEEIRLSTSFQRDVVPESGISLAAGLRYLF